MFWLVRPIFDKDLIRIIPIHEVKGSGRGPLTKWRVKSEKIRWVEIGTVTFFVMMTKYKYRAWIAEQFYDGHFFLLAWHNVSDWRLFVNVFYLWEMRSYTKICVFRRSLTFARKNGEGKTETNMFNWRDASSPVWWLTRSSESMIFMNVFCTSYTLFKGLCYTYNTKICIEKSWLLESTSD